MEHVNKQQTFGQKVQKLRNGVLYMLWNGQNKTPGTAYRQTECTGCPQGSPKGFPGNHRLPAFYFNILGREFTYQSSFFIKKSNFRKERGKSKWHFLQQQ
ncbi:MAG: hypothetical protein LIP16_01270 [Clostridium sp.]|nr:hypothetical protein [Clostridium sp.]